MSDGARIIKDDNDLPDIIDDIKSLTQYYVEIGIFGEDDSHILMIANVHEFGAKIKVTPEMKAYLAAVEGVYLKRSTTHIKIPERSYFRATLDQTQIEVDSLVDDLFYQVVNGEISAEELYNQVGAFLASKIQSYLTNLREPGLSEWTKRKKGSSNPLVDTGRLKQSITWKVRRGDADMAVG